ncbi:MAG: HD domain-containing protein [Clostridiales bacterium]|nr:HD domain-containing protein [Clostridiales bacterium]
MNELEIRLPPEVAALLERLQARGHEAFVVGGCVRDALRGEAPGDWDVCTSALPEETIACFSDCTVHRTGIRHGTVLVRFRGTGYEITTYRTEGGYADHRHPDRVRFVPTLEEDLSRRDFTVNAMAYNPQTGLVDPFGGQEDLRRGILRCVGRPEERFREDALRILRGLRFAARLGFTIEPETGAAMLRQRDGLDCIARERIFAELKGFLCGGQVLPLLLDYRELLAQFLPELRPMFDHPQNNPHHCYDVWEHTAHAVAAVRPEPVLRLTMLFHDCGKPDCYTVDEAGVGHFHKHPQRSALLAEEALTRLRCDNRTKEDVLLLIAWHDRLHHVSRASVGTMLAVLGPRRAELLMEVIQADDRAKAPAYAQADEQDLAEARALLGQLLAEGYCLSRQDLKISGRELMDLGASGPEIGRILEELLREVQAEQLENRPAALYNRAKALLER